MTLEEQVVSLLTVIPSIAGRVYPMLLPQSPTLPAVTYSRVSTTHMYAHEGNVGLAHQRLQFSCWARTHKEAAEVSLVVRQSLEGRVVGVGFADNEIDFYEPDTKLYHRALDMIIWNE